jgi:hypothetical protein
MASDIATGLFTLGGVVAGGCLTYLTDRRLTRRSEELAARLLLAETFSHIWGDTPLATTEIDLERLRARLEMLNVPQDRLSALKTAIRKCRSAIEEQEEQGNFDPDYGPGLAKDLLDEYRAATDAIIRCIK